MTTRANILLVDDEEILLCSLGADLRHEGYVVTTAENGKDALVKLKNTGTDLIVSDLSMPEMEGLELLEKVKEYDPEISFILLTGYGELESAVKALRLKADDYLLKPCAIEELLLRITSALEKRDALRKVKIYEEILSVCCVCGLIRDDTGVDNGKGVWLNAGQYLCKRTSTKISHGYCPKCFSQAKQELDSLNGEM